MTEIAVYADINKLYLCPSLTCQYIHSRSTAEKVMGHLQRDFLWKCANPFAAYPVVSSHHNNCSFGETRLLCTRNSSELNSERFQLSQTARRFGQNVQPMLRLEDGLIISRNDLFNYVLNI
ncbi:hypothetical protein D3C75_744690 [compost metagenome]